MFLLRRLYTSVLDLTLFPTRFSLINFCNVTKHLLLFDHNMNNFYNMKRKDNVPENITFINVAGWIVYVSDKINIDKSG